MERSPLTDPKAQRASLTWLGYKGEMKKMNQTSLCSKQEGCELGGARLEELERNAMGKKFPSQTCHAC